MAVGLESEYSLHFYLVTFIFFFGGGTLNFVDFIQAPLAEVHPKPFWLET